MKGGGSVFKIGFILLAKIETYNRKRREK